MIAGCIDRMRAGDCGGCERRDACAQLFAMFAARPPRERPESRRPARGEAGPRDVAGTIFRSLLGEVFKAVERRVEKAAAGSARGGAPASADPPDPATVTADRAGPVQREVEAWLEPRLADGGIGVDAAARALGYSRQTLYRRLKAEGTSFEAVLDGLRRRLALQYLRDDLSVKEVAWRLGFSDPAAFSRAFKRWTGRAPTARR